MHTLHISVYTHVPYHSACSSHVILSLLLSHTHTHTHTQACLWDTSDLSVLRCVRVSNTVLQVDVRGGSLVIGSTLIQLVDTENLEKRRTIADDTVSDESLEVCEGGREGGSEYVRILGHVGSM